MLPRLAYIQANLGSNEQDELVGSLARQVTALQLVVDLYIKRHGVLPELGGAEPAEESATTGEVNQPEPEAETLADEVPTEDDDGHASTSE